MNSFQVDGIKMIDLLDDDLTATVAYQSPVNVNYSILTAISTFQINNWIQFNVIELELPFSEGAELLEGTGG